MIKTEDFPNLTAWCEEFHAKSGLKVHPSSVPVDNVLEDLLGSLQALREYHDNLVLVYKDLSLRVKQIQNDICELTGAIVNIEDKIAFKETTPKKKEVKKDVK